MDNEYNKTKALLFAYAMHPDQVATLGQANCEKTINFIREHVVHYEQNASFFKGLPLNTMMNAQIQA